MKRTDDQIKTDIVNRLHWDSKVDASDVKVDVTSGVATLTGCVSSYTAQQAAAEDAKFTYGVVKVNNQLAVFIAEEPIPPTDKEIKKNAETIFTLNRTVDPVNIQIECKDGIITLKGTVDSYHQCDMASVLLSDLRGLKGIINKLVIVPSEKLTDEFIAQEIIDEFERSKLVDPENILPEVKDGILTLTGEVSTSLNSWRAEQIGKNTPGIIKVNNMLQVKYI